MKLFNVLKYLSYFIFTIFIISCSNNKQITYTEEQIDNPKKLYIDAFNFYQNGKYNEALDLFEKIELNFSHLSYGPKSLLMISYIYYDSGKHLESLQNIQKFKKFYPNHQNYDYAEYLVGLNFYDRINGASRDQRNTKLALRQFEKIIKKYPKTDYAFDAKYKIDLINEQLAAKEMYIARYYIDRYKWMAALIKLNNIIKNYSDTIFIDEALHRVVEINYRLGNINVAKKYASILGYNSNESDWYKKSYNIVSDKKFEEKIVKEKKSTKFLNIRKKIKNFFLVK